MVCCVGGVGCRSRSDLAPWRICGNDPPSIRFSKLIPLDRMSVFADFQKIDADEETHPEERPGLRA